jgi:hypothetical protein
VVQLPRRDLPPLSGRPYDGVVADVDVVEELFART